MTLPDHLRGKGAGPRNSRAVKSGAESELCLAPVREERAKMLRAKFPDADDLRIALAADRLARVELASSWLDRQGTVVRDKHGRVYDVADRLEKWSSRAEKVLAELTAEARGRTRFDLALEMAKLDDEERDDG